MKTLNRYVYLAACNLQTSLSSSVFEHFSAVLGLHRHTPTINGGLINYLVSLRWLNTFFVTLDIV